MKRNESLQPLSRDHHQALVICKRLKEALNKSEAAAQTYWPEVQARFRDELEPHFQCEEKALLPLLPPGHKLAARLQHDHAQLRDLITSKDPREMGCFADLLKAHVKFEERELFNWLQAHLTEDQLLTAMQACEALRPARVQSACRA